MGFFVLFLLPFADGARFGVYQEAYPWPKVSLAFDSVHVFTDAKQKGWLMKETGCAFAGTDVWHTCTLPGGQAAEGPSSATIPQLLTMRVDCRESEVPFTQLTVQDTDIGYYHHRCARVTYTKYYLAEPLDSLPVVTAEGQQGWSFTVEKGAVFDLHCAVLPFRETGDGFILGDDHLIDSSYIYPFEPELKLDGKTIGYPAFSRLRSFVSTLRGKHESERWVSCELALSKAYKWTMQLVNSTQNLHVFRLSSPNYGLPSLFQPPDGFKSSSALLFSVSGNFFEAEVLRGTSIPGGVSLKEKLFPDFYATEGTDQHIAAYFKFEPDISMLPKSTSGVNLTVGLWYKGNKYQTIQDDRKETRSPDLEFTFVLPVKDPGSALSASTGGTGGTPWWFWVLSIIIVSFAAAMAYIFRDRCRGSARAAQTAQAHS
ncbi:unnamed protein product [Symbiodinium natans]|uniref:Uncharacterized protein n=1 Tax=Symbiodinium natans TaxID=878477 RepID=A0A812TTG3_9DINO|nr:unnamed protein product [Symbiodinium natans]